MGKTRRRKRERNVVINLQKRGRNVKTPEKTFTDYLRLTRKVHNPGEVLAQKVAKAAYRVSQGTAPTAEEICIAGQFLFRGRQPEDVVLAHIVLREGHPDLDVEGVYSVRVPWAKGRVELQDVLKASFVHTCFKASSASSLLKVDLLTQACKKMLQRMKKNGYEKHDQIVSVIIATYTTSAQFADWMADCFKDGKTVETAIRTWGQNLDGRAVLGKLGNGPRRNRHTAKLKIEDLWALMSRLDGTLL